MQREAIEIAKRIVEAAADKQASDIVLLDTGGVCSFADYFIVLTGESGRQIEAIRQAIDEALKGEAITRHYEGSASSGWLLIDVGDVIVNIFGVYQTSVPTCYE